MVDWMLANGLLLGVALQLALFVVGCVGVLLALIRCDRLRVSHRIAIARELPHVWTEDMDR